MTRVTSIRRDDLAPREQALFDSIASVRGGEVRGPFAIWLHTPAIAEKANELGNALRVNGTIDKRLFELAILVAARDWTSQYEWYVHAAAAEQVGVDRAVVLAIAARQTPKLSRDDEAIVYNAALELMQRRKLSEPSYQKLLSLLGLQQTIELISVLGFYTMVAVVLNAFEAPVPGGAVPLDVDGEKE